MKYFGRWILYRISYVTGLKVETALTIKCSNYFLPHMLILNKITKYRAGIIRLSDWNSMHEIATRANRRSTFPQKYLIKRCKAIILDAEKRNVLSAAGRTSFVLSAMRINVERILRRTHIPTYVTKRIDETPFKLILASSWQCPGSASFSLLPYCET